MKTLFENKFYSLIVVNNKYFRFDNVIEYYQPLRLCDLSKMIININNK